MRPQHPGWFREDVEKLFAIVATRAIAPRVAERISFQAVAFPRSTRRRVRASSGTIEVHCAEVSGKTVCRVLRWPIEPPEIAPETTRITSQGRRTEAVQHATEVE